MLATTLALTATLIGADSTADRGRRLFNDPGLGENGVSCAHCHAVVEDEARDGDGLLRSGHPLWGAAKRPHWRGDSRRTAYPRVGPAINVCVQLFQGGVPLDVQDTNRLVGYLQSISTTKPQPPLQIVPALEANLMYDRPKYAGGDPDRGRTLFFRACSTCHPKGGRGLGPALYGAAAADVALKIREGNGLLRGARQPGAWMPFFGRDRLTDENVADIAAYVSTIEAPPDR